MTTSIDRADDDLARQRRKRETRALGRRVAEFPDMTVADVVADVLAASEGDTSLDVAGYLAVAGYGHDTIEAVLAYVHRHYRPTGPTGPAGPTGPSPAGSTAPQLGHP
jgi:hypothetical protein